MVRKRAKRETKKLYCGEDEPTFNLFWRANNGSQTAVRRIVKTNRFWAWVKWNLELSAQMDAQSVLLKSGMKLGDAEWDRSHAAVTARLRERPYHDLYANLSEVAYQATKEEVL